MAILKADYKKIISVTNVTDVTKYSILPSLFHLFSVIWLIGSVTLIFYIENCEKSTSI